MSIKLITRFVKRIYGILFVAIIISLLAASLYVSNIGPLLSYQPGLFYSLQVVAILGTLLVLLGAWFIPQRIIRKIDPSEDLEQKLARYFQALQMRFALVTGTALLVSIIFVLTADDNLMMILAIIILYYILSRPTVFKTVGDLKLDEEEKKQLSF
jgi:predicted lysophospholipase L1 biosynthesis ABC-type transport system permease subunit